MPIPRARQALAALAFLATAIPCAAAELGTLFHTPDERDRLDRMRRGDPDIPVVVARVARHEITGFIRRSDGRDTVWIDGRPVPVSSAAATVLIEGVREERPASEAPRFKIERKKPR